MPQKEKITRELSLERRAIITGLQPLTVSANLSVLMNTHPGAYIFASNSGQIIAFQLPVTNTANGVTFQFFNINTGGVHLVADTNTLVAAPISVNAAHGVKSINISPNRQPGIGAVVFGNGSRFYVFGTSVSNASAPFTEA